ncbi:MAG: V-type ATP synthase subunit E [Methanoregula sp.]|jgi:V/A-type H+-transporting ATPase subunit E|nr:V-type ATP synthase subunit E [Methanoregula sp.]
MSIEQLIESVEGSAGERIAELKENAYKQSVEIRKAAEGKDEAIKKKHLDAVKKTVDVERNKLIAKIKDETRMQFTRTKDEVYKKAFFEAKKILSSTRSRADYENNFRKMLQEVFFELEGEDIQLHIDKRDENLCKKLLSELKLNFEMVTDITSEGGLNASTKDGKFIVFNTIESRFEKAKSLLKPEIFTTLYGGQSGV